MIMEPLKIVWHLKRPMICNDIPLHLDSLVAWAAVEEAKEKGVEDYLSVLGYLPLGKTKDDIWQASQLIYNNESSIQVFSMTKPFNMYLEDAETHFDLGRKKQFKAGEGKFKGYDLRLNQQWRDIATAWCIGDKERLEILLPRITNLGKISRNNFGAVSSVEIVPDQQAEKLCELRTTPLSLDKPVKKGFARAMRVCSPPYWEKTRLEPCQVPIDVKELIANL